MTSAITDLARRRPVMAAIALTVLVSLPFLIVPEIDRAASAPLVVPGGFLLIHAHTLDIVRYASRGVMLAVLIWIAASLVVPLLISGQRRRLMPPRAALFLLVSLAIGPGIVVGRFKDIWGRARPRELSEWGGDLGFSGAWEMSTQCASNCSFISGEAASAMWLMALALVVPATWRMRVIVGALLFAVFVSAARMLVGAHFLSDVLIAWCMTLIVIALVHGLFYRWFGLTDEKVDAVFARLRAFLQAPFRLVFGGSR